MIEDHAGKNVKLVYKDGERIRTFYGEFEYKAPFISFILNDGKDITINESQVLNIVPRHSTGNYP